MKPQRVTRQVIGGPLLTEGQTVVPQMLAASSSERPCLKVSLRWSIRRHQVTSLYPSDSGCDEVSTRGEPGHADQHLQSIPSNSLHVEQKVVLSGWSPTRSAALRQKSHAPPQLLLALSVYLARPITVLLSSESYHAGLRLWAVRQKVYTLAYKNKYCQKLQ